MLGIMDMGEKEQYNDMMHTNNLVANSDMYSSFIESFKTNLSDFELLNEKEIINFIFQNRELLDLIKSTELVIKEYFPDYDYALEFNRDPEIPNFNQIILYVKGNKNSFDEDWEEIKKVNREIRKFKRYEDFPKYLFFADLW